MAKLQKIKSETEDVTEYVFECPGCGGMHMIRTEGPRPCWKWNGSIEKPTFSPSYFVGPGTNYACHSFITDGKIQFLGDCHHELKGQTVELPEWEGWPE